MILGGSAACVEYAEMMKGGQFHTSLPIGIDATNQGLQIYALALRDHTSAQATNCLPCELPNDIYQQVCDTVLDMIATDTHEYAKGGVSLDCLVRQPRDRQ